MSRAISSRSSLAEVALAVGRALEAAGIRAVLTGGACAHLYTRGRYASHDLDFVLVTPAGPAALDAALAAAGFVRQGDRYVHPRTPVFVEFPPGPLGIGRDLAVRPTRLRVGGGAVLALSATDSCRDRLAAFYHWNDRQALQAAAAIARRHRVHMKTIRSWSEAEGFRARFDEFASMVREPVARGRRRSGGRPSGFDTRRVRR